MEPETAAQPPQSSEQYDSIDVGSLSAHENSPVEWTASEYVAHHKNASWYIAFAAITLVATVGVYFITQGDIVATLVIAVVAVLFAIAAARPPRVRKYQVGDKGVMIDNKPYPFMMFKSFSLMEEGAINSISLWSMKRFMPPLSLYYPPEQEELILSLLSLHLPFEERASDPIDRLMRKLHF